MGRLAAGPWRDLPDREPRLKMTGEALELARTLDDPTTLAYALEARLGAIMGPVHLDELLDVSREIERAASATNDGEKILMSHVWRMLAHLFYGNVPQVFAERHEVARLAAQLRQGPQNWFLRCTDASLAFFAGRFGEAEELALQAYEAGRRAEPYALFAFRLQMLWIRMEQARESEMKDEFADSMERFMVYPVWRAVAPHLLLTYGTEDQARAAFRETFPTPRPVNEEYLLGAGVLADAATSLGEPLAAASLYDELLPHAHLTMGGIPDINLGTTSRVLGRLAHLLGKHDAAERHFVEAMESNDRMGARPWAAWARHSYAQMLIDRNERGDRERANVLLSESRTTARELGMVVLEQRIAALTGTGDSAIVPVGALPSDATIFRREGEYWTIVYEGDGFRLRDSKGLHYIARLLSSPGREVHALDLIGPEAGFAGGPSAMEDELNIDAGDGIPILDDDAKQAYRTRLTEIDAEIDEARSWGDAERAARAELERDAIIRQLAGAVGLGGRDRKAGSAAERARVNVTRAIRSAVARLAEQSPALGMHLDATLRTGTYCSYVPDPSFQRSWVL
jgi:tetratricopeptide (TPR) repeat protein